MAAAMTAVNLHVKIGNVWRGKQLNGGKIA